MIFGRLIGLNIFFAGFAVLVQDVLSWNDTLRWAPVSFGRLWYEVIPPTFDFTPIIARSYLWPPLWNDGVAKLLPCWAFAVLMVAGALLVYMFRERHAVVFPARSVATARPGWRRL